jgi:hypothetical protein
MSASGQNRKSSKRANVFCSSLNNGHQDHSLLPIGRRVAFDHRSGSFVFLKPEFLRVNDRTVKGKAEAESSSPPAAPAPAHALNK